MTRPRACGRGWEAATSWPSPAYTARREHLLPRTSPGRGRGPCPGAIRTAMSGFSEGQGAPKPVKPGCSTICGCSTSRRLNGPGCRATGIRISWALMGPRASRIPRTFPGPGTGRRHGSTRRGDYGSSEGTAGAPTTTAMSISSTIFGCSIPRASTGLGFGEATSWMKRGSTGPREWPRHRTSWAPGNPPRPGSLPTARSGSSAAAAMPGPGRAAPSTTSGNSIPGPGYGPGWAARRRRWPGAFMEPEAFPAWPICPDREAEPPRGWILKADSGFLAATATARA
jgi:hypothetical protein